MYKAQKPFTVLYKRDFIYAPKYAKNKTFLKNQNVPKEIVIGYKNLPIF